jgi:hypothetical protein
MEGKETREYKLLVVRTVNIKEQVQAKIHNTPDMIFILKTSTMHVPGGREY